LGSSCPPGWGCFDCLTGLRPRRPPGLRGSALFFLVLGAVAPCALCRCVWVSVLSFFLAGVSAPCSVCWRCCAVGCGVLCWGGGLTKTGCGVACCPGAPRPAFSPSSRSVKSQSVKRGESAISLFDTSYTDGPAAASPPDHVGLSAGRPGLRGPGPLVGAPNGRALALGRPMRPGRRQTTAWRPAAPDRRARFGAGLAAARLLRLLEERLLPATSYEQCLVWPDGREPRGVLPNPGEAGAGELAWVS
jgi:hypothetical protein